jgi:ATP-dependent RNA helicase DeaD
VATNVAARGLHLPDVDLIVHADLPLNADSLIHRSGRTGRAGRKGTAVVLATLAERRKAERLLGAAHVAATWTPPPAAQAIAAAARARLADEILAADSQPEGERPPDAGGDVGDVGDLAARLEAQLSPSEIIRRLLSRELARLPAGEALRPVEVPRERGEGHRTAHDRAPRTRDDFANAGVTFRVNIGAKHNADPRWLLPLICRRGAVTRREVGAIRIGPQETLFQIAGDAAHDFELAARERDPRALHVTIGRADGPAGPEPSRHRHAARPQNRHRGSEPAAVRSAERSPVSRDANPRAGGLSPYKGKRKPARGRQP